MSSKSKRFAAPAVTCGGYAPEPKGNHHNRLESQIEKCQDVYYNAIADGFIEMTIPEAPKSRNQRYMKYSKEAGQ